MLPNNSFGSLIVQDQTLGDVTKLGGGSKLGAIGAAVEHEGRTGGGFPVFGPQVSDDASGRDLSSVIQRQFNGYGTEEIVKEHSVADITPSRLEEKMNMLNFPTYSVR